MCIKHKLEKWESTVNLNERWKRENVARFVKIFVSGSMAQNFKGEIVVQLLGDEKHRNLWHPAQHTHFDRINSTHDLLPLCNLSSTYTDHWFKKWKSGNLILPPWSSHCLSFVTQIFCGMFTFVICKKNRIYSQNTLQFAFASIS